jgi:hypothetical protein
MGGSGGFQGGTYPSLNEVADLVRAQINDDKNNGAGIILTNQSTTLTVLLNSAIREVFRECRISGDPVLIKDNYVLLNLPVVNSPLGAGVANPRIQQALTFTGFFDGLQINGDFALPSDLIAPIEVWERPSGTEHDFRKMDESTGGLRSRHQGRELREWEWRQNQINFVGSIEPRDIRIRYYSTYVSISAPNIDFHNTFIPILDSHEAIADRIILRYSRRLSSTESAALLPDIKDQAAQSIFKLRQQVTRQRQHIDFLQKLFKGGLGRRR